MLSSGVNWFERFSNSLNVVFTKEDFEVYSKMVEDNLMVLSEYLDNDARILDVGCGLGCGSIPLSTKGYEMVGIDNDPRIIEAARQNGKNFGGRIEFRLMDAFDVDKEFAPDSFDACMHGGLLEHFSGSLIRVLIDKQFIVAPLIFCWMPVRTGRTLRHFQVKERDGKETCVDGIERNLWTSDKWLEDIFAGYKIMQSEISSAIPQIGDFDELFVALGRESR